MKLTIVTLIFGLFSMAAAFMNDAAQLRALTVDMIEKVYNRKDVDALSVYYAPDAMYMDNMFGGKRIIRNLREIQNQHLEHCPLFRWTGSVFTIENSVVCTQTKTIRYTLAVHGAMLDKYHHDVVRFSILHEFNAQNMIVRTEMYGDMTALWARLMREALPTSEVNRMKVQRIIHSINEPLHSLDSLHDLIHNDFQGFVPEGEGKPQKWEELVNMQKQFDVCFEDQDVEVLYVLHEHTRPNIVSVVWKWSAKFVKQCPAPYQQFKPTGQIIKSCGVTEYLICEETGQILNLVATYNREKIMEQMKGNVVSMNVDHMSSLKKSSSLDLIEMAML